MATSRKKRTNKTANKTALKVSERVKKAFRAPYNGPNPIGADGVVIGVKPSPAKPSIFYYVIEKNGKYFYEDPDHQLHELPTIPRAGQGVIKQLTQRGSLVADIDRDDTPGTGGYCFLLSIENLKS